MADFRLCSTSRSHSQAGLYHYAHEQNQRLSLPSHTLLFGLSSSAKTSFTYYALTYLVLGLIVEIP